MYSDFILLCFSAICTRVKGMVDSVVAAAMLHTRVDRSTVAVGLFLKRMKTVNQL